MSSRNNRKWKSLNHKVEHLRLEVEHHDDVIKDFEVEFLKELSKIVDGSVEHVAQEKIGQISTSIDKFDENIVECVSSANRDENIPNDIKKLWKSIAIATHPDLTKNDPYKKKLYLNAAKAIKNGSIDEIVRIAIELGIEIPDASVASIHKLESLAVNLQKKIFETTNSILWQWGEASPEVKLKIMDAYISMKKYKKKL